MTYKVLDTTPMSPEEFAAYSPLITREMRRFCEKFPDDMTVEYIASDILEGRRKLWIVLNAKDEFILFFTTYLATIPATGKTIATASTLCGKDYRKAFREMNRVLEDYAAETGADFYQIEGREGHGLDLQKCGYMKHAVVWRKPVMRDEQRD